MKLKKRDSCGIATLNSIGKIKEDSKSKAEALNQQFVSVFTEENMSFYFTVFLICLNSSQCFSLFVRLALL
jgi:hypothetical protein